MRTMFAGALRSHVLLLALGALPLVGELGCTKMEEAVRRRGSDAGTYSVVTDEKGEETQIRMGPGPVPPEFPPGMPLYPGATFASTARTAQSVVVGLSTSAPPDSVYAFYAKQPGFEQVSDQKVNGVRVLRFKHTASGKDFQLIANVEGRTTNVALVAPL